MAKIQDRKGNFYCQKQSIRDELSAPQYLESAGDELIKYLSKKQTNTSTSLQEQLDVVQNFEKGFELKPDDRKGITSLEDFKKHVHSDREPIASSTKWEETQDLDELMRITGLSRHELELSLCEKPSSKISQLYRFAIGNRCPREKRESLENSLPDHPINRLKEIELECFGQNKKPKLKPGTSDGDEKKKQNMKKKKPRKRKKKVGEICADEAPKKLGVVSQPQKSQAPEESEEVPKASSSRPSLWDVKDMKKWSESKKIGCKPQAFYTIENGKIIKLEKESGKEDTT